MNTTCVATWRSAFGGQFLSVLTLLLLILVATHSSAQTPTALNGPGNVFLTASVLGDGGTGPTGIAVADFNGDGHPDIVTANNSGNAVTGAASPPAIRRS